VGRLPTRISKQVSGGPKTVILSILWAEEVALCKLLLSCHFYLSLFCLKVKNFHRSTGCVHITKDIDKMARMGDIAHAASD
jgi:hypothetical protein